MPGGGVGMGGVPNQTPGAVISGQLGYVPGINQTTLNYRGQGIPGFDALNASQSANISALLNPTDFTDVSRTGAEAAVAGGFSGSGFGAMNTARLTMDEKLKRQALGSKMLNDALSGLPKPFDPTNLLYHSRESGGGGGGGPWSTPGMPALPVRPPVTSPGEGPVRGMYGQGKPVDIMADIMKSYGLTPDTGSGVPLYNAGSNGDTGGGAQPWQLGPEFTDNSTPDYSTKRNFSMDGGDGGGDGYTDNGGDQTDPSMFDWETP